MPHARPLVLGIETSCDDTACAVVDGEGRVLASVVSSQLAAHRPYGGVVPEIASREHLGNWPRVAAAALEPLDLEPRELDLVAATRGPGLVGALLVGLSLGKAMAYALERPFYGVHHLEGHLYSPFLSVDSVEPGSSGESAGEAEVAAPIPDRFAGLILSGGHSLVCSVDGGATTTLVDTRDDAMGEVFDKVGKRLGLPFPQGPLVDRLAERGDASRIEQPVPRATADDLFFSFSGLKSSAIRELERLERAAVVWDRERDPDDPPQPILDLLAAFRAAAVRQVIDRLDRLHRRDPLGLLAVSGGVAANRLLRRELGDWAAERGVDLRLVPLVLSGDNAAMIAFAALLRHRRGDPGDPFTVEAESRIPL